MKLLFIGLNYNFKNKIDDAQITINNCPITHFSSFGCLIVQLDKKVCWEKHIGHICAKIGAGIGVMRRAKPFVFYNSILLPYFDYCSPLWDKCGSLLKEKLKTSKQSSKSYFGGILLNSFLCLRKK